jgi:phospholipid-binding lipoprotein MlaA
MLERSKRESRSWNRLAVAAFLAVTAGVLAVSLAMAAGSTDSEPAAPIEDAADPWEPFNSEIFWFNHDVLDRYVLKPVAKAWRLALPDVVQRSLRNAIDNTNMPSRLLNSLAQGKFIGRRKGDGAVQYQ